MLGRHTVTQVLRTLGETDSPAPARAGGAQRFEEVAWLMPMEESYGRAIPLRWLPAVMARSTASAAEPCKEWQAGVVARTRRVEHL